jgi:D-alanine-D-alanine ligase-like ATP-grasp enzyme
VLVVGRTANVHTGATIEDVTADLHPALADLAIAATAAVGLPVAGVDLIVDSPDKPDGTVIEVNEQPGLANHEPQPTAARFIDLLFPETKQA